MRRILFFLLILGPVLGLRADLTAVMGAYPPEVDALRHEFIGAGGGFAESEIAGIRFQRGRTDGREIILFQAGMSLVNAAYQLQIALDHFPITRVIFAGVAGGVDPDLHEGDVVVPDRWAYHAEAAYLNPDGKGGYLVPEYFRPQLKNFGMIFPDSVTVRRDGFAGQRMPFFPVDPGLLEAARRAALKIPPLHLRGRPVRVAVGGVGVSGTVFLDNAEYREWVQQVWHARCVDMESAAYAQVCWANRRPLLVIRGLSDLAGGQRAPNPIDANEAPVSVIAATLARLVVDELPAD